MMIVGNQEISADCAALLELTQQVADDIGALRNQVLEFKRDLQKLILAAKDAGASWGEIAAVTGGSVSKVRHLARGSGDRAWPSATNAKEPTRRAIKPKVYDGPGVPIIEAARRLGVSRPTIYAWIEQGKLQTVTTSSGTRLVVLNDAAIVERSRRRANEDAEVHHGDA
jgi:excisionase family DNA binding protein